MKRLIYLDNNAAGRFARNVLVAVALAGSALAASAVDNTLLIQQEPGGRFKVWHIEGETNLTDHELDVLEVSATPEGGAPIETSAGPARAFQTPDGILISVPGAPRDKALLVDRTGCGNVSVWHSAGATSLTDEQLTELVMAAVPGGGKRVTIGELHAKPYLTRIGVIATLWKPAKRRPAAP